MDEHGLGEVRHDGQQSTRGNDTWMYAFDGKISAWG